MTSAGGGAAAQVLAALRVSAAMVKAVVVPDVLEESGQRDRPIPAPGSANPAVEGPGSASASRPPPSHVIRSRPAVDQRDTSASPPAASPMPMPPLVRVRVQPEPLARQIVARSPAARVEGRVSTWTMSTVLALAIHSSTSNRSTDVVPMLTSSANSTSPAPTS